MYTNPLFLAVLAVFFLASCATISPGRESVESLLEKESFRQSNLPVRTLRIAVVVSGLVDGEHVTSIFRDASNLLEQQVGVRFAVTLYYEKAWETNSMQEIFSVLKVQQIERSDLEHELFFGVPKSYLPSCLFPCKYTARETQVGGILNGRYVALLHLSRKHIIHEVGHAFGVEHSPSGLMASVPLSEYFSVADREMLLKNKWKKFPIWW